MGVLQLFLGMVVIAFKVAVWHMAKERLRA